MHFCRLSLGLMETYAKPRQLPASSAIRSTAPTWHKLTKETEQGEYSQEERGQIAYLPETAEALCHVLRRRAGHQTAHIQALEALLSEDLLRRPAMWHPGGVELLRQYGNEEEQRIAGLDIILIESLRRLGFYFVRDEP